MKVTCELAMFVWWVYGEVSLVKADHLGWAITSAFVPPIAIIHGTGHLLGAW